MAVLLRLAEVVQAGHGKDPSRHCGARRCGARTPLRCLRRRPLSVGAPSMIACPQLSPRLPRGGCRSSLPPAGSAHQLVVRGAREHNLKNIDLDLPRDAMIVFTGLSGSGKSSLAFDTIFAEGQRRYVESLSAYARQFLGQMDKPDVDFIEGLSPAVSIDQKSTSRNPRSTVGTITEVYDYMRLLWARAGRAALPGLRRADRPADAAADRRPAARAARGHAVPGAGAGRPGPQGRVRATCSASCSRKGLLARPGRRRGRVADLSRRRCRRSSSTRSTWSSTASRSRSRPSGG